jgi:hypothetical protein
MSYKPKKGAIQPIVLYSEDGTAIEFKYLKQQEKERIVLANKLEVRVVAPEGEDDTGDDGTRMISFPHVCDSCGEEFTTKQGLNSHSRVHK